MPQGGINGWGRGRNVHIWENERKKERMWDDPGKFHQNITEDLKNNN